MIARIGKEEGGWCFNCHSAVPIAQAWTSHCHPAPTVSQQLAQPRCSLVHWGRFTRPSECATTTCRLLLPINPFEGSIRFTMEKDGQFADFDDEQTYNDSQSRALLERTRNFVVQFGKEEAQIAFDLDADDVQTLLDTPSPVERPVRWM